jgi:hypothetical protein
MPSRVFPPPPMYCSLSQLFVYKNVEQVEEDIIITYENLV